MTRRTLVGGGVRVPSRRSCLFFLSAAAWAYVPRGKRIPRAWECDPSAQGAADGGANAGARPAPSYRVDSKSRAFSFVVLKCRGFLPLRDPKCYAGACADAPHSTVTVLRSVPQEWQTRQDARIVHHAQAFIAADILLPTSAAGSPSTSKLFSTPNSVLEQWTQ